jgi:hypothetical protein
MSLDGTTIIADPLTLSGLTLTNTIDASLVGVYVPYIGATTDVDMNSKNITNITSVGTGTITLTSASPYIQFLQSAIFNLRDSVGFEYLTAQSNVLILNTFVGIGDYPCAKLSVYFIGDGNNAPTLWNENYAIFGQDISNLYGSAVGITYNTTSNYGALICSTPGTAYRPMYYVASSHIFNQGGISLSTPTITFTSGTFNITDGTNVYLNCLGTNSYFLTNVGIGTTSVGKLGVQLDGLGANTNPATWSNSYALIGTNVSSTTGSAVSLTYNTASNYGAIMSSTPGTSYRTMYYVASNHIFTQGNMGVNTTSIGRLGVLLGGTGVNTVPTVWSNQYVIFGTGINSTTGSAIGFTYNTAGNYSAIISATPGTSYRPLYYVASSHIFNQGGISLSTPTITFTSGTFNITDGTNVYLNCLGTNSYFLTNVGIGTTSVGKLGVQLDGLGANTNPATWSNSYALIGTNVSSTTGSAVSLTYNTAGNYGAIMSSTPGTSYRTMYYVASNHIFSQGNLGVNTTSIGRLGVLLGGTGVNTVPTAWSNQYVIFGTAINVATGSAVGITFNTAGLYGALISATPNTGYNPMYYTASSHNFTQGGITLDTGVLTVPKISLTSTTPTITFPTGRAFSIYDDSNFMYMQFITNVTIILSKLGVGTNTIFNLGILLGGTGTNTATSAWSTDYVVIGLNPLLSTTAGVGITYNTAGNYGAIVSATPGTGYNPMYYSASAHNFTQGGLTVDTGILTAPKITLTSTTPTITFPTIRSFGIYDDSNFLYLQCVSNVTTINSLLGVGSNTVNKFSVLLTGTGIYNPSAWTSEYIVFGLNPVSTTGSGLGFTYNTAGNYSSLMSLTPGTSWRPMYYGASSHIFYQGGIVFQTSPSITFNTGTLTITDGTYTYITCNSNITTISNLTGYLKTTGTTTGVNNIFQLSSGGSLVVQSSTSVNQLTIAETYVSASNIIFTGVGTIMTIPYGSSGFQTSSIINGYDSTSYIEFYAYRAVKLLKFISSTQFNAGFTSIANCYVDSSVFYVTGSSPAISLTAGTLYMSITKGLIQCGTYGTSYDPIGVNSSTFTLNTGASINVPHSFTSTAVTINAPMTIANQTTPGGQLLSMTTSTVGTVVYTKFQNTAGVSTQAFMGLETSSGTGIFGSGQPYSFVLGNFHNAGVYLYQNNTLLTSFNNNSNTITQNISGSCIYSWTISGNNYMNLTTIACTIVPALYSTSTFITGSASITAGTTGLLMTYSSGISHLISTVYGSSYLPMDFQASSFNFLTGNVGIGSASPAYKLDVAGEIRATSKITVQGYNSAFGGSVTNNQDIIASFSNNTSGNWIGATFSSTVSTATPDRVVAGSLYVGANPGAAVIGAHNYNLTAWATLVVANSSLVTISDERLKENIVTEDNDICYNNIKNLHLVRYNYREDGVAKELGKDDRTRVGVLAQELQQIFPKSIYESEDPMSKETYLSINTEQMNWALVGAVQKLQEENEVKTQQVIQLTDHLIEMTISLNALTERLKILEDR